MSNGGKRCLGILLAAAVLVSAALGLSTVATAGTPTVDGLLGWWRLDEGGGTYAWDSSVNAANGSLSDPDGWTTEYPYSVDRVIHSLDFSTDLRALTFTATVPYAATTNVTLSAWVRWNGVEAPDHPMPIIYHGDSGTNGYGLYLDGGGAVTILLGSKLMLSTHVALPANVWTHVAAAEDGAGDWAIYVNGAPVATLTKLQFGDQFPNPPSEDLFIGGHLLPAYEHFHGQIADARFYSRALTQPEVAQVAAVYPAITGVSPNSGPNAGGTDVTISGSGFSGATAVTFGGQPASAFTVTNGSTIVATAPAGAGPVHIAVTTELGGTSDAVAADLFTYPPVASATTLTASPGTLTYGAMVSLTAQVSASETPTGMVTFRDGGTQLATAVPLNGAGQATLYTTALNAGSHSITATYSGDACCQGSTSSAATVTVGTAPTTIGLTASTTSIIYGQTVTLSATVSSGVGTPTGQVMFRDGSFPLGTVDLAAGSASLSTSALSAGSHTLTASYLGAPNYGTGASSPVSLTVTKADTTSLLSVPPDPSTYGQSVTLTATVTPNAPGGGVPTGTVTFAANGTSLGTAILSAGQATFSTSALPVGSPMLTATYGGSASFFSSASIAIPKAVTPASTTINLTATPSPAVYGNAVTLTAQVSGPATIGVVRFNEGMTTLGSATLDPLGRAQFVFTDGLSGGPHSFTATYDGDPNCLSSAGSVALMVNPAVSDVTLAASQNPSTFGQPVTLTAHVQSVAGLPTGTVFFYDGATTLGSVTLDSGSASLTTATMAVGYHTITAQYLGAPNYSDDSATLGLDVIRANTATVLTSTPSPSTFGQSVALTATVTPVAPGAGTPTGTVTFSADGTPLGTATLTAGQATLSTAALSGGSHSLTATYAGDVSFNGSTATPITRVVNPKATTTTLMASPNPAFFGQTVTLTANVLSGVGIPTGTVTFMDGLTPLGTPASLDGFGQATLSVSTLSTATHQITAVYSGDANDAISTSTELDTVINPAATDTTLTASTNPAISGETITLTAHVASPDSTPTGQVRFSAGAALLGTVDLVSGSATLDVSSLPTGPNGVSATYLGSSDHAPSTSSVVTIMVNPSATTTTVTASPNPAVVGQSITLTATVTMVPPGSGVPVGLVTFTDGMTAISSIMLSPSGQATVTTTALSAGPHTINATFGGNMDSNPSVGSVALAVANPPDPPGNTTPAAHATEGSQALIPVTPAPGVDPSRIVVYYVVDGREVIVPLSSLIDGQLQFIAPATATFYTREVEVEFADIDGHWAQDAIGATAARGLFNGTGNDRFEPDSQMTRGMLVTALARLDGVDLTQYSGSSFSDVPADSWYSRAVAWASESGVVNGIGGNRFAPEERITREEIAAMIRRYMGHMGLSLEPGTAGPTFVDGSSVSNWANDAVEAMRQLGIVLGRPDGRFDPQGDATRAECSAMLQRLINAILSGAAGQ